MPTKLLVLCGSRGNGILCPGRTICSLRRSMPSIPSAHLVLNLLNIETILFGLCRLYTSVGLQIYEGVNLDTHHPWTIQQTTLVCYHCHVNGNVFAMKFGHS